MKRILHVWTLVALVVTALWTGRAQAAPTERCFAETGFCISGVIRTYWEQNGGLPVFGYPITPIRDRTIEQTWSGPTQWFERDRLEDHRNEGKGVLAGRLGAEYVQEAGRAWQPGLGAGGYPYNPECRTFYRETGYQVCGSFRTYWEQNGGVARFGYPISETRAEQLGGETYTVQYFERRRMEDHPGNAGTPYAVQLGLLGRDIHRSQTADTCPVAVPAGLAIVVARYRDTLGCPNEAARAQVPSAIQAFEHGWMLWMDGTGNAPPMIFAVYANETGKRWRWELFADTYHKGERVDIGPTPPGLLAPARGFGKVWHDNPELQRALGWATAQEASDTASLVFYADGAWIVYLENINRAFVMQSGGFGNIEQP